MSSTARNANKVGRRDVLKGVAATGTLAVSSSVFWVPRAAGQAKHVKFSLASSESNPRNVAARRFAELVIEGTGGSLEVEVYDSGVLARDDDAPQLVQNNVIEMSAVGLGTLQPMMPKLGVVELPFLFDSYEAAWRALDSNAMRRIGEGLQPEQNLRILGYWENGFRHVHNNARPIEEPSDLNGLKIRVPPWRMWVDTFNALGAAPTPLPWAEVYTSLRTGVVDGLEIPLSLTYFEKIYEVTRYLSLTNHQYGALPVFISESVWQSFTPEERTVVEEANEEAKVFHRETVRDDDDSLLVRLQEEFGMEANEPPLDPFREASLSVWEKYEEEFGDDLIQEIVDAANRA
jgi:TRAP-type transport system periplasmic protein